MNIKASGRSALLIAAGLWICTSGPLHAAGNDAQPEQAAAVGTAVDISATPAKPARHHATRKTASKSHKADKQAAQTAKKAAEDETAKAEDAKPGTNTNITPAVANANAQWPSETPTTATNLNTQAAENSPAPTPVQPEQPAVAVPDSSASNMQVVASDQLNDLDRAATDSQQPPLTLAKATIDAPAEEATSSSNSPWDKTSMVGKIFVAFGGLLTMASAARMFMA